ncbi:MAG: hypothetical protein Q9183_004422, partial [Haloplaca sp. 2 TL-2023]
EAEEAHRGGGQEEENSGGTTKAPEGSGQDTINNETQPNEVVIQAEDSQDLPSETQEPIPNTDQIHTVHQAPHSPSSPTTELQPEQQMDGRIRTLDGEIAGDEFAGDAINYQILLGKIDALLEKLRLDA